MKLHANVTRFAPNDGYIVDVETQRKATEEEYEFFGISPGWFLCVNGDNAYAISEYMQKIGCGCEHMTYRCKEKEVCKHLTKFMSLDDTQFGDISEEMAELLQAAGWSGTPLTPPDRPENRSKKPKLPNIHDPERKPAPQAAQRAKVKKEYEGRTAEQIVQGMDTKELERNARRGGLMAIAEVQRRKAEAVSA